METPQNWKKLAVRNSPKAFGRILDILIHESVHTGQTKKEIFENFCKETGIHKDRINGWIKGNYLIPEVASGRDLNEDLFIELMEYFWKKESITSHDDIRLLAQCAGKYFKKGRGYDYEDLLKNEWFAELSPKLTTQKNENPVSGKFIFRKTIILNIIRKIKSHETDKLILLGQPGIGKTILLKQIKTSQSLIEHFSNQIFYGNLAENEPGFILEQWFYQCYGHRAPIGSQEKDTLLAVVNYFSNRKVLIIIDGVSDTSQAKKLILHNPEIGSCLLATRYLNIANDLSEVNDQIIKLAGFNETEIIEYLKVVWDKKYSDDDSSLSTIKQVAKFLHGNPLGFKYATQRALNSSWLNLLSLLKEDPGNHISSDMLQDIYLPMLLWFNALPADYQNYFASFCELPELIEYDLNTFMALWGLSEQNTINILYRFEQDFSTITSFGVDNKCVWKIHQQAYYFSKHMSSEKFTLPEKTFYTNWIQRYTSSPKFVRDFSDFFASVPAKGYLNKAKFELSNPFPENNKTNSKNKIKQKEWFAIQQNSNYLSTSEYGFAYKISLIENKTNKYMRIVLIGSISLLFLMIVSGLFLKQILISVISFGFCLLLAFGFAALEMNFNRKYRVVWHWLYKLISDRKFFDGNEEKGSLKPSSRIRKLFKSPLGILIPRLLTLISIPLLIIILVLYQVINTIVVKNNNPPPGQIVLVDSHKIHIFCTGKGQTTYLLESGLFNWSISWKRLQEQLSKDAKVCSYDREGYGWSDSRVTSPTPALQADLLQQALLQAKISPPFVIVSDGTGSFISNQYARQFPDEVEGLIFLLPTSAEYIVGDGNSSFRMLRNNLLPAIGLLATQAYWQFEDPPFLSTVDYEARPLYRKFATSPNYYWSMEKTVTGLLNISVTDYSKGNLGNLPLLVIVPNRFISNTNEEYEEPWMKSSNEVKQWSNNSKIENIDANYIDPTWRYNTTVASQIENFSNSLLK